MVPRSPDSEIPPIEMVDVAVGTLQDLSSIVAEHVTWKVTAGDFWVVAGLQGSGKTDFLLMTGGLMPPLHGDYHLFGEPMPIFEDARLHTRLRLGLVFDGGQLFNHLTIWENIALPLRYHRNVKGEELHNRVQQFVDAMQLEPWIDRLPSAIGRNWRKRVGLARALILKPEVLLVDNPLGGLDLPHLNWWLSFLDQLGQGHELLEGRKLTLVATASDLSPWQGRARQFAALKENRFIPLGTQAEWESSDKEHIREFLI